LIVEGALLAVPSAAAGAMLSSWALRAFSAFVPEEYLERGASSLVLDARVLMFVVALSGAATVFLSLAPLFFAQRIDLNLMLGEGGRTAGASPRHVRTRNALLVAQMTVTLVLLVGAGLFVSSFVRLTCMPLGFDPHDRIAMRITLSGSRYAGDAPVREFAARLLDRARATPGVRDAAVDSSSPLGSGNSLRFVVVDRPRPPEGHEPSAILRAVSADYFRTLGIRLVSGRAFVDADAPGAPRVAIVNQHLARRLFPGVNPIGQRLELLAGQGAAWMRRPGIVQIVGVADNVKDVGMNEVDFNDLYLPFPQAPVPALELVAGTSIPAATVSGTLRAAAAGVDPNLPVMALTTFTERLDDAVKGDRFNLILIASFAVVAILLAAVGIHGAMACAVQERRREFGVRLALGAQPGAIIRASLRESARFGVIGGALGLTAALVLARLLGSALYLVEREHEGVLYGVTTTDPVALAAAAIAVVVVATISGVIPARQATKVDPLIALRSE
jgi:putative ABC transport system permease protein